MRGPARAAGLARVAGAAGRAQELERLGLAKPVRRHVLAFAPNWEARLKAMELHLDLAKRMAQERQRKAAERLLGLGKQPGLDR